MPRRTPDLTGKQIGRLRVQERVESVNGNPRWRCLCDCGVSIEALSYNLQSGHTQSCGCLKRLPYHHIHGHAKSRTYEAWSKAKARCYNPNDPRYARYGGRGIEMCPEWRDSFSAFFSDMGECPTGFSIERVDNDGPYAPHNCTWLPRNRQNDNKHTTIRVDGKCLMQVCRERGLRYGKVWARIKVLGWDIERAISQS